MFFTEINNIITNQTFYIYKYYFMNLDRKIILFGHINCYFTFKQAKRKKLHVTRNISVVILL